MNKYIVPFKLAIELKRIGFVEPCHHLYDEKGVVAHHLCYHTNTAEDTWNVTAPLYDQVYEWLRTEHNVHVEIQSPDQASYKWSYTLHVINKFGAHYNYEDNCKDTYEECREAALEYAIKFIKK